MRSIRRIAPVVLLSLTLLMAGCTPEGSRERGGGSGADPGNRSDEISLHGDEGAFDRIYYQTPAMGMAIERSGRAEAIIPES